MPNQPDGGGPDVVCAGHLGTEASRGLKGNYVL